MEAIVFFSNYSWLARFQSVETKNQGFELILAKSEAIRRWTPATGGRWNRIRKGNIRILRCSRLFLLAFLIVAVPVSSFAAVFISVGIAPPPLPVYEQPWCPGPGYIWTPGYWAYGDDGYFWVPGTWVLAPQVGFLWTLGYWGWGGSAFIWHVGYWGPTIGFYGGVNYGFGYTGYGYEGGYWRGRNFYYNRNVNRVNVTSIHNVYNRTVVNNVTVNRVSYNGGNGGINARPNAAQEAALRGRHIAPTTVQPRHEQMARSDRAQWASVNQGRPQVAATPKPTAFHAAGVVKAKNAPVTNNPAVSAPRTNNAGNARASRPANNNVPRPPERANASNPNGAGAAHTNRANNVPHPNNPTALAHTNQSPPAPHVSQPAHQNQPAPHVSQPPAQHQASPHQSAPSRSKEPHGF